MSDSILAELKRIQKEIEKLKLFEVPKKTDLGGGGGGSGHTIQDEGTPLTARANLNFVGAGVAATDDAGNDASLITIPGIEYETTDISNPPTPANFFSAFGTQPAGFVGVINDNGESHNAYVGISAGNGNWFYQPLVRAIAVIPPYEYLLPSFYEQDGHEIYMLWSDDGKNFAYLGSSYDYINNNEIVRDAWLYDDGETYWMVMGNTEGSTVTTTLSLAKSTDLITWTYVGHIDLSAAMANVNMVYAGKWFIDDSGDPHVLVPVTNDGLNDLGFTIFETHPTNAAMTEWSAPAQVTGTALPDNMIDPFLVKKGTTYYLWFKNEDTKYIEIASSSSPFSGYTMLETGDWAGWGDEVEAVSLVQIDTDTWRVYMEKYQAATGLAWSESSDDWSTWTVLVDIVGAPWVARSAGIFRRTR